MTKTKLSTIDKLRRAFEIASRMWMDSPMQSPVGKNLQIIRLDLQESIEELAELERKEGK